MSHSLKIWLLFCSTLTIMTSAILAPSLPAMTDQFSSFSSSLASAEWLAKLVIAIPGGVIAVSAIGLGIFLDKVQKPNFIFLFLFLYGAIGSVGFFIQDNIWGILISRAVLGVAVAGLMVSVTTIAASFLKGPSFGQYIGLQAAFGSFGGVCFLVGGGVLADLHWAYPFLVHSVAFIMLIVALVLGLSMKNDVTKSASPTEGAQQHSQPNEQPNEQPATPQSEQKSVMPSPENGTPLSGFAALALIEVLLLYVIPLYFPFYLSHTFNADASTVGMVIGGVFAVTAVASIFYGKLLKGAYMWPAHVTGFVIISLGFMILYLTSGIAGNAVGMVCLGVGFGICRPNLIVWLFSCVAPFKRGMAMGLMTSFYFFGQFLSPFVFEPILKVGDLNTVFLASAVMALCVIGGLVVFQTIKPKSPQSLAHSV